MTIIAENHGFRWNERDIDIVPTFLSLGPIQGVNNSISYAVSEAIEVKILSSLPEDFSKKHLVNMLLDLPIKSMQEELPIFTYHYSDIIQHASKEFSHLQRAHKDYVKNLLWEGIERFNNICTITNLK